MKYMFELQVITVSISFVCVDKYDRLLTTIIRESGLSTVNLFCQRKGQCWKHWPIRKKLTEKRMNANTISSGLGPDYFLIKVNVEFGINAELPKFFLSSVFHEIVNKTVEAVFMLITTKFLLMPYIM